MFTLRFDYLLMRYYLMMLVAILAVLTHQAWLIILAFAIAVSAILGYRITWPKTKRSGKIVTMERKDEPQKRKVV